MKYHPSLGREWVVVVVVVTVVVVVAVVVVVLVVVVAWRRRVPCSPGRGGGDAVIETAHKDGSGAGTGGRATDACEGGGGARTGN